MEPEGQYHIQKNQPTTYSYPEPDQSSLCPPVLFLEDQFSFQLHLFLPSVLFPSDFTTRTLHVSLLSSILATCPTHRILLDLITQKILGEECRSLSSSLCSFLHSPVSLSLLGPNILLSTPLSNILSLHSSLNVRDQVSNPHTTTGKTSVLYVLIFKFWIAN